MSSSVLHRNFLRLLPIAALSLIAACSSNPPTLGDQALAHGKQWNRGAEMVEDGQDLIKKGNSQIEDGNEEISDGNANISKGKNLVSQGRSLIAEAEASMRAQQIAPPAAAPQ